MSSTEREREREREDGCVPGIYLIGEAQRSQIRGGEAFPAAFFTAVLDGGAAGSRAGFFSEIACVLRFPDYFGRNWDAVYDCVTDLHWLPAEGYVLLLDGFGALARNDPEQWRIGLKVLRDACVFWRPLRTPLFVLLYGPGEDAPGVPALPSRCLLLTRAADAP
jgi:hypothetical protein